MVFPEAWAPRGSATARPLRLQRLCTFRLEAEVRWGKEALLTEPWVTDAREEGDTGRRA
jgi:hypothetical protein